jgi:membrane-associated protease RseP (regulator of RpoE activity)
MLVVLGIVIFFGGLLLSIAWHELGHLLTAKLFGIKVTQYMVGFGRTIWSRRPRETEYGVKLVPLGGYIRMIGMFPPKKDERYGRSAASSPWRAMIEDARKMVAEEVTPQDVHRQFYQRPPWKRIIVMLAGPVMNLILAFAIFASILMAYGTAVPTTTVASVAECVLPANAADTTKCPAGAPKTPAALAGFRAGDRILEFNGRPYQSWDSLRVAIRDAVGPVSVLVDRAGKRIVLHPNLIQSVQPNLNGSGTSRVGFLGLSPTEELRRQNIVGVVGVVGGFIDLTAGKIVQLPQQVPGLISAIGGKPRSQNTPVGIVGASRLGGQVLSYSGISLGARLVMMLDLLAGVNLSLFVLNMLPILPLDGGHIVGALWEAIRRRLAQLVRRPDPGPFDTAKLMPLAYAVSLVFIAYSLLLLVADIVNPVTLF